MIKQTMMKEGKGTNIAMPGEFMVCFVLTAEETMGIW